MRCITPAGAVSDLFVRIAAVTEQQRCGPNGCQCDGIYVADIIYDAQLGYPIRIHEWVDRSMKQPWPLLARMPLE